MSKRVTSRWLAVENRKVTICVLGRVFVHEFRLNDWESDAILCDQRAYMDSYRGGYWMNDCLDWNYFADVTVALSASHLAGLFTIRGTGTCTDTTITAALPRHSNNKTARKNNDEIRRYLAGSCVCLDNSTLAGITCCARNEHIGMRCAYLASPKAAR